MKSLWILWSFLQDWPLLGKGTGGEFICPSLLKSCFWASLVKAVYKKCATYILRRLWYWRTWRVRFWVLFNFTELHKILSYFIVSLAEVVAEIEDRTITGMCKYARWCIMYFIIFVWLKVKVIACKLQTFVKLFSRHLDSLQWAKSQPK